MASLAKTTKSKRQVKWNKVNKKRIKKTRLKLKKLKATGKIL
jgi:hypothetical protein